MKKIITIFLTLICVIINQRAYSQTNVSGSIHSNTTWSLTNSPYHVTGNTYVFPGNTLTIEPGVRVIFDGNFELEIRGELIANGTSTNKIYFCGKMIITGTDTTYVLWKRVHIEQNNKGKASFSHCIFKDAQTAIENLLPTSALSNCLFEYNTNAVAGFNINYTTPSIAYMNNCIFRYNGRGISFAMNTHFNNCSFLHNDEGIYVGNKSKLINCEFSYNRNGINIYNGDIRNSTFTYNDYGIKSFGFDGFGRQDSIRGCTIQYNEYGIDDSAYSSGENSLIVDNDISFNKVGVRVNHAGRLTSTYTPIIKNNKLCHNIDYNAVNITNTNKNFTDNCFCTDDSVVIENKLYDGFDDVSLGLLTYNIYDSSCTQKQLNVFKKLPVEDKDTGCLTFKGCNSYSSFISDVTNYNKMKIFPMPFHDKLQFETNTMESATVSVSDAFGKIIHTEYLSMMPELVSINTTEWPEGLYILTVVSDKGVYTNKVIKN
jgi:hypothetical protein